MKLKKSMIGRYPVMTDGKIVLAYDCDVFKIMGVETIYHIGNQLNHYYSNDKSVILSKVGKCGKTETNPCELKLVNTPSYFPTHYAFSKFID